MKKMYTKPMVVFEEFTLDTPIAANCQDVDSVKELMESFWFNGSNNCAFDFNELKVTDPDYVDDTLCYNTLANPFLS